MPFKRYAIQMKLSEIGKAGQEKLSLAKVAMIGVGGLGAPLALNLAAAGIGHLVLVDGDQVNLENLHRQVLFTEEDIGKAKVVAAKTHLSKRNSEIKISAYAEFLSFQNISQLLSEVDLILDCTDNFHARFLINQYCVEQKKVFVYASVDQWRGQVALFTPKGPCLACLFSHVKDGLFQDCSQSGVLGVTASVVSNLQGQVALHWLLFQKDFSALFLYDAKKLQILSYKIQKQKYCEVCGEGVKERSDEVIFKSWNEVSRLMQDAPDQNILIDLRDAPTDALKGALHIPMVKILNGATAFDKNKTYILYCEKRIKSPFVREVLRKQGVAHVYVLQERVDQ